MLNTLQSGTYLMSRFPRAAAAVQGFVELIFILLLWDDVCISQWNSTTSHSQLALALFHQEQHKERVHGLLV